MAFQAGRIGNMGVVLYLNVKVGAHRSPVSAAIMDL